VCVWDLKGTLLTQYIPRPKHLTDAANFVSAVASVESLHTAYFGLHGEIVCFDARVKNVVASIDAGSGTGHVFQLRTLPGDRQLLSLGSSANGIQVWDTRNYKMISELRSEEQSPIYSFEVMNNSVFCGLKSGIVQELSFV
jgi:hypothetical protein